MGKIRILSDQIANKIAAGEVVERPASVVKELLENSMDAGAMTVRIDVEAGGRRLMRIADDGCGMLRDDALLAFERHATSKLSDAKDLLSIATLGFRGEALPSIASVSRLVLETRAEGDRTGTRVEISGGRLLRCDDVPALRGTSIEVADLFFNVPARKKFLRSEQTELAHIASLVTHYGLAHPEKAFVLNHGRSTLLDLTPVETLRERVYQVFGSRMLEDLIELEPAERGLEAASEEDKPLLFRLRGFVSAPSVQKLNRNSIYLFVNGRLIRDRLLLHALSAAYYNLMPPACFPVALLFVDCDFEEVDVNVHPAKTEVRFRHGAFVHDFVRDAVRGALIAAKPAALMPLPPRPPQPGEGLPYSEFSQKLDTDGFAAPVPAAADSAPNESRPGFDLTPEAGAPPRLAFDGQARRLDFDPKPIVHRAPDSHGLLPDGLPFAEASLASLGDLHPLGQLHDSFIIAAGRDGLWIIDQHVAHERILFEQVLDQQAEGRAASQRLLMPLVVRLTPSQQIEFARIAAEMERSGFECEPFGNRTLAIKAVPAGVGAADAESLVWEILDVSEQELRQASAEDLRRSLAASIACRAAIKINTRLDGAKIDWLLRELAATSCPMSCPHGRPIALRYTTREILRSFHRI